MAIELDTLVTRLYEDKVGFKTEGTKKVNYANVEPGVAEELRRKLIEMGSVIALGMVDPPRSVTLIFDSDGWVEGFTIPEIGYTYVHD